MKVLLLGFSKISYMPFLNTYLKHLKNHETHLIYWNRDGKSDTDLPVEIKYSYMFDERIEEHISLRRKLPSFIKYRHFALRIIKEVKFDFVIVLHTTPGMTILDMLVVKFRNNYILDYRDISLEKYQLYKLLVLIAIKFSRVTFISSSGYKKYLPKSTKIQISHNLLESSLEVQGIRNLIPRLHHPLRIRYWGLIRHEEINILLISKIANDNRFELHYHGREQRVARALREYCKKNKVDNVFFHGDYSPRERHIFAVNTELIHNLYDNDFRTTYAMGNKIYDGVVFRIPNICNSGSYMGDLVEMNGIGISIDPSETDFADKIYNYYVTSNWEKFDQSCSDFLSNVLIQNEKNSKIIDEIINQELH